MENGSSFKAEERFENAPDGWQAFSNFVVEFWNLVLAPIFEFFTPLADIVGGAAKILDVVPR